MLHLRRHYVEARLIEPRIVLDFAFAFRLANIVYVRYRILGCAVFFVRASVYVPKLGFFRGRRFIDVDVGQRVRVRRCGEVQPPVVAAGTP